MKGAPLVSCIMLTAQRARFVPLAVAFFLRQTYRNRELIVLDDGAEPVDHLLPNIPSIRYCRLARPRCIGEKRNIACEMAAGDIIAHWDDDDWIAPLRLAIQVDVLESCDAQASGLSALRYFDLVQRAAWLWQSDRTVWLAGGSLCYRKQLWSAAPFRALDAGEDLAFVHDVGVAQFVDLGDADFYVAVVHGANTSARPGTGPGWKPRRIEEIELLLGADLDLYAT